MSARVAVPMVTSAALDRMYEHDPEKVDNVIVEWIIICILQEMGKLSVVPLAFGPFTEYSNTGIPRPTDLFADRRLKTLPDIVPRASINMVHSLLQPLGIPCTKEQLGRFTVSSLINQHMASKFLMVWTWKMNADTLVSDCSDIVYNKVVEAINKTTTAGPPTPTHVMPVGALTPVSSKRSTTASTPVGSGTPLSPMASCTSRNVNFAWTMLTDIECVKATDVDKLKGLLRDQGVTKPSELEDVMETEGWDEDFEPIIACLKRGKQRELRRHLGLL